MRTNEHNQITTISRQDNSCVFGYAACVSFIPQYKNNIPNPAR